MKITTEPGGRLDSLCNLSEVIVDKIMEKFSLTEEQARKFVE